MRQRLTGDSAGAPRVHNPCTERIPRKDLGFERLTRLGLSRGRPARRGGKRPSGVRSRPRERRFNGAAAAWPPLPGRGREPFRDRPGRRFPGGRPTAATSSEAVTEGAGSPSAARRSPEDAVIPGAARIDGLPHRAGRVGVFGGRVEERTAALVLPRSAASPMRPMMAAIILRGGCFGSAATACPPEPILLFDIGEDEIILRREVIVEGRLGDAGFRDDAVDARRHGCPPRRRAGSRCRASGGARSSAPGSVGEMVFFIG